jgi:3-oxoacyl-[acyl-carrier-protein] synthase-1
MSDRIVITAVHCMTPIGLDALSTAIAVRAGISGLRISDQFDDSGGEPILESCIPWLPSEPSLDEDESDAAETETEEDTAELDADDDEPAVAIETPPEEPDEEDDEAAYAYELARQADVAERLSGAARHSLGQLLAAHFPEPGVSSRHVKLVLAAASPERPGPRYAGSQDELAAELAEMIRAHAGRADWNVVRSGQASGIRALQMAVAGLAREPSAVYIVGAIDSLLSADTLNWLEDDERLKSGSFGRHQGLSPSEAVGFLVAETASSARRAGRTALASVAGVALAQEPGPFVSGAPSRADGLTEACLSVLDASGTAPAEIEAVLSDLDGEFHRAKDWAIAETRCLGSAADRTLLHPADCFGSIGAASAVVLLGLGAIGLARGWNKRPVLVVCSDDAGEVGAVVLMPARA